jgi:hypothetical protein
LDAGGAETAFYDEFVSLKGRRLDADVQYSRIENVSKVERFTWGLRTRVQIKIEGESEPLEILANPANKSLRKGLYSWLEERASQRYSPTRPPK